MSGDLPEEPENPTRSDEDTTEKPHADETKSPRPKSGKDDTEKPDAEDEKSTSTRPEEEEEEETFENTQAVENGD